MLTPDMFFNCTANANELNVVIVAVAGFRSMLNTLLFVITVVVAYPETIPPLPVACTLKS